MGRLLLEGGSGALLLESGSGGLRAEAPETYTLGVLPSASAVAPGSLAWKLTRLFAAGIATAASAGGTAALKVTRALGVGTASATSALRDVIVTYVPAMAPIIGTPARRRAQALPGAAAQGAQTHVTWSQPLDPTDLLDFVFDFDAMLETDETIATITAIGPAPEGVALGLTISTGTRAPMLASDGRSIIFWQTIATGQRSNSAFDGAGALLGIETTVVTSTSRTEQRTLYVRVAQQ